MDYDTQLMGTRKRFQTTQWNLVRRSQDRDSLNELISIYWKPLYFFVRQHGFDNESSKDIVQEFLTRAIERGLISKADPTRGRFRTFLISALGNFIRDRSKAGARRKRGGGRPMLSLDFVRGENDYILQANPSEPPDVVLNRAWARGLWERALTEVRCTPEQLKAFRLYMADKDYRSIAAATGLSETEVNSAIRRVKGELKALITSHIRETVSDEDELEAELTEFKCLLTRKAWSRRSTG
jgi:RNA polymerase sigma-70 factor (ECF subfamily)